MAHSPTHYGIPHTFTVDALKIFSTESPKAALKSASLIECLRSSTNAREKLAIMPWLDARSLQASSLV